MKPLLYTRRLPARYRAPVRAMCRKILSAYPNTAAFVVVGSVADGSCDEASDVDLVWVLRGRRRRGWRDELEYDYEGAVELVPFNMGELRRQFALCSPMAHSVQQGIVIYDPGQLMDAFKTQTLGLPSREWMQEWRRFFSQRLDWGLDWYQREREFHRRYCRDECTCRVPDILTRAAVNLVRVLLATQGLVSRSKAEMREHYPIVVRGTRLRGAMEKALEAHHEKRDLTLAEAREIAHLGQWARTRLEAELSKPEPSPAPDRSIQRRRP